ncbi:hypothetical protein [Haliangium ochraceum]|uniref:hypothetical protein n=1 Tax=Haliangium ochraceum TaxID=80816 RepID=UPI00126A19A3|nr:hypothetical protein [Haliangium ochraceum]
MSRRFSPPPDRRRGGRRGPRADERTSSDERSRSNDRPRSNDRGSGGGQRRAFSPAREHGRVQRSGDPEWSEVLARALTAPQRDSNGSVAESLTHALHTYPARLHPATARQLVSKLLPAAPAAPAADADAPGADQTSAEGALKTVIDPFCGAGTVLVEARRVGALALGVDANPLAALIARAKTWTAPAHRRALLRKLGRELSAATWNEGKAARRADYEPAPLRLPAGVDPVVRSQRLEGWFPPHVRRELEFLATGIDDVRGQDPELADVLVVVLSSILYKVSRRASDTDPRRVERRIGRGMAARYFGQRVELLVKGLDALASSSDGPPPVVHTGDARKLDELELAPASVSLAVTSPPYAGTYDYAEQHRLRLDFLGLPAGRFRAAELGSRQQFAGDGALKRRARRRYKRALGGAMEALARVLVPGGWAAVILGDSVAGDRAMWADEVLEEAASEYFSLRASAWQERGKLGSLEYEAFGDAPKREHIFLIERRPH